MVTGNSGPTLYFNEKWQGVMSRCQVGQNT